MTYRGYGRWRGLGPLWASSEADEPWQLCYHFYSKAIWYAIKNIATPAPTNLVGYNTRIMSKILSSIPADLLDKYSRYELSSEELGNLTGFHPASLRRAIKRPPRQPKQKNKTTLIQARKAFRASIAHLPPREIRRIANVSLSTANRIRKMRQQDA